MWCLWPKQSRTIFTQYSKRECIVFPFSFQKSFMFTKLRAENDEVSMLNHELVLWLVFVLKPHLFRCMIKLDFYTRWLKSKNYQAQEKMDWLPWHSEGHHCCCLSTGKLAEARFAVVAVVCMCRHLNMLHLESLWKKCVFSDSENRYCVNGFPWCNKNCGVKNLYDRFISIFCPISNDGYIHPLSYPLSPLGVTGGIKRLHCCLAKCCSGILLKASASRKLFLPSFMPLICWLIQVAVRCSGICAFKQQTTWCDGTSCK